jgi:CBS domain-containing protein
VSPDTRLGEVTEILRASPYRIVPVVEHSSGGGALLVGVVTERALADALLTARTPEERARLRSAPVRELMEPPRSYVTGFLRVAEAAARMDAAGEDTLPVVEPGTDGNLRYLGLLSRSDLVQELVRPFRPPMIGGLATPMGVYLTTGAVSGGAGTAALIGSGFALWVSHTLASLALGPLQGWAGRIGGWAGAALGGEAAALMVTMTLYLLLVRLSPIAGYHAAEHQVVHAVERGEPLLVDAVRAMPRVHPRCGTNLVAGLTLFGFLVSALGALAGRFAPALEPLGWALAGVAALSAWRTAGAWLQQHVTTRPASDAQIRSGIRAAREVLERHGRDPYAVPRPHQRLWRLGFVQMMGGYLIGYAVLEALLFLAPGLARTLGPLLPLNGLL